MIIRTAATAFAVFAACTNGAQAQISTGGTTAEPSAMVYTLRLSTTAAGTAVATLGSLGGPYRYSVTLLPQSCSSSAAAAPPLLANASLRDVSTMPEQFRAELRIPLASGGTCALVGAFDIAAEDKPPVHTEPDPRGPGQGKHKIAAPIITSDTDLTAKNLMTLGSTLNLWGDSVNLAAANAVSRTGGICTFPYSYTGSNIGSGLSEFTINSLNLGNVDGPLLAADPLLALAPGGTQGISGTIGLPSGHSTVVLSVDSAYLIDEISEANNVRQIEVDVQGSCN